MLRLHRDSSRSYPGRPARVGGAVEEPKAAALSRCILEIG